MTDRDERNSEGRGGATRVVAVADEPLLARGAALAIDAHSVFRVAWAESLERASRIIGPDPNDVVLWLSDWMRLDTVEPLRRLRESHPLAGLCILVQHAEPAAVQTLLEQDPARFAFILRTPRLDVDEIVTVVNEVVAGKATLEPWVLQQLFRSSPQQPEPLDGLTGRELEVLELLSLGLRNCEIARRTWRSEKAIEKHVSQVFAKLGLDSSMAHLDRRVTATRIFLALRSEPVRLEEAVSRGQAGAARREVRSRRPVGTVA